MPTFKKQGSCEHGWRPYMSFFSSSDFMEESLRMWLEDWNGYGAPLQWQQQPPDTRRNYPVSVTRGDLQLVGDVSETAWKSWLVQCQGWKERLCIFSTIYAHIQFEFQQRICLKHGIDSCYEANLPLTVIDSYWCSCSIGFYFIETYQSWNWKA